MSNSGDLSARSPESDGEREGRSADTRRERGFDAYEQNPRGPVTIIGGFLGFLFAVIFASFVTGVAQYVMIAIMIASVLLCVRGFVQFAAHKRRGT